MNPPHSFENPVFNFFYFDVKCPVKRLKEFQDWLDSDSKIILNYSLFLYQAIKSHDKYFRNNLNIIKYIVEDVLDPDFSPNNYIEIYYNGSRHFRSIGSGVRSSYFCPMIEACNVDDLEIINYFLSFWPTFHNQENQVMFGNMIYTSASRNKKKILEYCIYLFLSEGMVDEKSYVFVTIERLKKLLMKLYECKFSFEFEQRIYIEFTDIFKREKIWR